MENGKEHEISEYMVKFGLGHTYMVYSMAKLFEAIRDKFKIRDVVEYDAGPEIVEFPERNWDILEGFESSGVVDAIFLYQATPESVEKVKDKARYYIFSSVNDSNFISSMLQRMFGIYNNYYHTTLWDLVKIIQADGYEILQKGYYDSPPWFDHSTNVIFPTKKLGVKSGNVKWLLFCEHFNNRLISHHTYVVCKKRV